MGQTTGKKAESRPRAKFEAPRVVGESSEMRKLKSMVETVAARQCTLLVQGESGSGKELIVRHVHACSRRRNNPFIAVDCSTLRDSLLVSELFGHVKGSFTGAERDTLGFVRAADGGTLFLDEIGEMPLTTQVKLTSEKSLSLQYSIWDEIEEGWDYAYVTVSNDQGVTWEILPGTLSSSDNPMATAMTPVEVFPPSHFGEKTFENQPMTTYLCRPP